MRIPEAVLRAIRRYTRNRPRVRRLSRRQQERQTAAATNAVPQLLRVLAKAPRLTRDRAFLATAERGMSQGDLTRFRAGVASIQDAPKSRHPDRLPRRGNGRAGPDRGRLQ